MNVLTDPLSGNIYFDSCASQHTLTPDLTGTAVALGFDGCAGLTVTSYNADSQDRLTVAGASGSLFNVNDSLVGTVFSVNDAAGLPIIEVNSDATTDTIAIGEYGTNALFVSAGNVGIGTATPTSPLHVCGNIAVTGTVDGRDIVADGSKLDGIACGAGAGTVTEVRGCTNISVTNGTGVACVNMSTGGAGAGAYGCTSDNKKIDTICLDAYGRVTCIAVGNTGLGDITGVTAGSGLAGGGTSGDVTLCHSDTSSQASCNCSGGTVIQDVTLDTYGHVTALGSYNLDGRYYTETEVNNLLACKLSTSGKAADSELLDGVNGASYLRSDADDVYTGNLYVNDMIFKSNSNVDRNFKMQTNDSGTDIGLSMFAGGGCHAFQLYGTSATSQYGFLDGNWANWDIRKTKNGAFEVDEGSGLQRVFNNGYHPNADTLTTARTIAGTSFNGSANININYNCLTNKPTIPTNNNQLTNGASYITASSTNTLTNKTWNGVAIADAYISSASCWNACATSAQGTLATNALPKAGGTVTGNLAVNGNTCLGNANNDFVHINDRLFVGATDSGTSEFWFGEGTTGDVDYGSFWCWDSGYTHYWCTVNASTKTKMMSFASNDTSKLQWFRNFDMNSNKITELATPTASTDAANKCYVDACIAAVPTGDITAVTAGAGLVGGGTSGSITICHNDTSSQASCNCSGGTVIQDVTLDTYGHVTALGSYNLDGRYYTETEVNNLLACKLSTTGCAANSALVGSIAACRIVYGSGGRKTTNSDPNSNGAMNSGFYDIYCTNAPTNTWYSYITMAHTNTGNEHGHQIAGSFYSDGDLFNRHYDGTNAGFGNWTRIWNEANDGAGSGLDADKLDGCHASSFQAAGTYNTIIGTDSDINTSGATVVDQLNMTDGVIQSHSTRTLTLANLGYTGATNATSCTGTITNLAGLGITSTAAEVNYTTDVTSNIQAQLNGKLSTSGCAANSQLLDGIDSSAFLRSNANDSFTGQITMGTQKALIANNYGRGVYGLYNSARYQHVWSMGTSYNLCDDGTGSGNLYGLSFTHTNVGGQSKAGLSHQLLVMHNGSTVSAIGSGIWTSGDITVNGGDIVLNGTGRIQGVDTVSSGTDATNKTYVDNCLACKQAAGTYNTIIGTDSDINTSGCTVIDCLNMTDGVIQSHTTRSLTLANLGYTGATNANYITNNNQLTNGAGYITSSGTANNSTCAGGLVVGTGRNNSANQIVRTNASGYAEFGWINTTSGNTTSTITDFYVNTNDGYIRKATNSHVRSQLNVANGATACTGTTTASNSQTFTNKSGCISQWTNNSGYTTCTGNVVTSGSTFTGNVTLNDSVCLRIGSSADLSLFHNGNHSYIDNDKNSLYIRNNVDGDDGGDIYIMPHDNENGIIIYDDSRVDLYFNNSSKFCTQCYGTRTTGTACASYDVRAPYICGTSCVNGGAAKFTTTGVGGQNAQNYWGLVAGSCAGCVCGCYSGGAILACGNVSVCGTFAKSSGCFDITHPLPALSATKRLSHSFVESPQADNIYSGVVQLTGGSATVNIDAIHGMTSGTLTALNRCFRTFTTNETNWDPVRGSVTNNTLTIESCVADSTATVSWMVLGERHDPHMLANEHTDNEGRARVEYTPPTDIHSEGKWVRV